MNKKYVIGTAVAATAAATLIAINARKSMPKGAMPVRLFDLNKYLGKWYEIARFNYLFENHLSHVTANYSLNEDGSIRVDNKGYDFKNQEWKESVGKAKPNGDADEGRLKVSFFGPFYAGYNVLAIDGDYNYALVAGRNLDYLWLLSRDTNMPKNIVDKYLKMAADLGYKTQDLVWVDHD